MQLVSFMMLAKLTEMGLAGVGSRIDLVFGSVGAMVSPRSRLALGLRNCGLADFARPLAVLLCLVKALKWR